MSSLAEEDKKTKTDNEKNNNNESVDGASSSSSSDSSSPFLNLFARNFARCERLISLLLFLSLLVFAVLLRTRLDVRVPVVVDLADRVDRREEERVDILFPIVLSRFSPTKYIL